MANLIGGNNVQQNNPLFLRSIAQTDAQRLVGNLKVAVANLDQVPRRPGDEGAQARRSFREKYGDNLVVKFVNSIKDSIVNAFYNKRIESISTDEKKQLGGTAKLPPADTLLPLLDRFGPAGVRVLASQLLDGVMAERKMQGREGPLDLSNPADHAIVSNVLLKIVSSVVVAGNQQGLPTAEQLANVDKLVSVIESAQRPPSDRVGDLLDVVKLARSILSDPQKKSEYARSMIGSKFTELTDDGPSTFLRMTTPLSNVVVNLGFEGIKDGATALGDRAKRFFEGKRDDIAWVNSNDDNVLAPSRREELSSIALQIREQLPVADSKSREKFRLAEGLFEVLAGRDGVALREKLGQSGATQLREMALEVIKRSKDAGATDEQANKNARVFYVNVLLLKGLSPQLTVAMTGTEFRDQAASAFRLIQSIANQVFAKDRSATDYDPYFEKNARASGLNQQLDALFQALRLPTTADLPRPIENRPAQVRNDPPQVQNQPPQVRNRPVERDQQQPDRRDLGPPPSTGDLPPMDRDPLKGMPSVKKKDEGKVEGSKDPKTEPKSKGIDYDDFIAGFKEQVSLMKGIADADDRGLTQDEVEIIEAFESGIQTMEARKRGETVDVGGTVEQFSTQVELIRENARKDGRDLSDVEQQIVSQFERGIEALLGDDEPTSEGSEVSSSEHRGPEAKTENTAGTRALRDSGKDDVEDLDDEDDSSSGDDEIDDFKDVDRMMRDVEAEREEERLAAWKENVAKEKLLDEIRQQGGNGEDVKGIQDLIREN